MNLEVVILPDPERCRLIRRTMGFTAAGITTASATITCFADVCAFANNIIDDVYSKHGPYFFKLHIRAPGKPFMEYEMPHGDMLLQDRLWIPIDMYEAFYVDVT